MTIHPPTILLTAIVIALFVYTTRQDMATGAPDAGWWEAFLGALIA
jgi:uncharacterized membrane protein